MGGSRSHSKKQIMGKVSQDDRGNRIVKLYPVFWEDFRVSLTLQSPVVFRPHQKGNSISILSEFTLSGNELHNLGAATQKDLCSIFFFKR